MLPFEVLFFGQLFAWAVAIYAFRAGMKAALKKCDSKAKTPNKKG